MYILAEPAVACHLYLLNLIHVLQLLSVYRIIKLLSVSCCFWEQVCCVDIKKVDMC